MKREMDRRESSGISLLMSRTLFVVFFLILVICFAFSGSAVSWGPVTPTKTFHEMQSEVTASLDLGNPYIADMAMTMAADYPGQFSINQVRQIYDTLAQGGWYYYSDPSDPSISETYQNANKSLQKGKIKNTIGMGDCDDFAILMTSLVQSIGGSARVIFAYETRNPKGHAYSELYLGRNGSQEVDEIASWLRNEYETKDLPGINRVGDEVWLNLDWGNDITKAANPGGPYFGTNSKNIVREIVWQPDQRISPGIVPVIDGMDSTEEWQTLNDSKGSTIKIDSVPGRKGNAVQLSYDLKEGGWVGISKEIDPNRLSSARGPIFSYLMMERPNTIELRLVYNDGTSYGISYSTALTNAWSSKKTFFANLRCISPENKCELNEEFNTSKVRRLEFIISNNMEAGNEVGSGTVILDDVRGLMAIPAGSPWERAEEERDMIYGQVATGDFSWSPQEFTGFYYDIDNDIGTEMLSIYITEGNKLSGYNPYGVTYSTCAQSTSFEVEGWGAIDAMGFLGELYFAGYNYDTPGLLWNLSRDENPLADEQLLKVLIDDCTAKIFTSATPLKLKEGYELAIRDIDGIKCYLELSKNGEVVHSQVVAPSQEKATLEDKTFYYKGRIPLNTKTQTLVTIAVHFRNAFRDANQLVATVDCIWQISESPTEVKVGSQFDNMTIITVVAGCIYMSNRDNEIVLDRNREIVLMRDIGLKTANSSDFRYYIYKKFSQFRGINSDCICS